MIDKLKKKIFIHIGYPKTGTSSLQFFLMSNYEELTKYSIFYPMLGGYERANKIQKITKLNEVSDFDINLYHDNEVTYGPYHHALAPSVNRDKTEKLQDKINLYNDIIDEFEISNCEIMIISSEVFTGADYDYIAELSKYLSKYDCKIIAYTRNVLKRVESGYLEILKNIWIPLDVGIDEFINKRLEQLALADFYILKKWSLAFGKNNLVLRLYERNLLYKNDIIEDFFNIVGVKVKIKSSFEVNISLSIKYARALEAISLNHSLLSIHDNFSFRQRKILKPLLELSKKNTNINEKYVLNNIVKDIIEKFPTCEISYLFNVFKEINDEKKSKSLITNDTKKLLYFESRKSIVFVTTMMNANDKDCYLSYYENFIKESLSEVSSTSKIINYLKRKIILYDWSEFVNWWITSSVLSKKTYNWVLDFYIQKEHLLDTRVKSINPIPTAFMMSIYFSRSDLQKTFSDPLEQDCLAFWKWWIINITNEYMIVDVFPINTLLLNMNELKIYTPVFTNIGVCNNDNFLDWYKMLGFEKYIIGKTSIVIQNLYHSDFDKNNNYLSPLMVAIKNIYEQISLFDNTQTFWSWWLNEAKEKFNISKTIPINFNDSSTYMNDLNMLVHIVWKNRSDLIAKYPNPLKNDSLAFQMWWNEHGYYEYNT